MKTDFSENLRALRKERHVTQEQLAEAMGVSAGAVYKWEQALSTPDIAGVMELASFFGVSVDALVGYRMGARDRNKILEAIQRIKLEKSYAEHGEDVERWLRWYPNDFDVVYSCGVLLNLAGLETGNRKWCSRSIALLERACTLLSQNRDPKISETEIHQDIAIAYLSMGEREKGLAQLQQDNPCGIHDDILGHELAIDPSRRQEAVSYLSRALIRCTASLYRIVLGFCNLFCAQKDFRSAMEILRWISGYLNGLRTEGVSFLDRESALVLAIRGSIHLQMGEEAEAAACLRAAHRLAVKFDAAPNFTSQNIRYCAHAEPKVAYDSVGGTTMDAIHSLLLEDLPSNASALNLWEEICHEA